MKLNIGESSQPGGVVRLLVDSSKDGSHSSIWTESMIGARARLTT